MATTSPPRAASISTPGSLHRVRAHGLELAGLTLAILATLLFAGMFLRWLAPWLVFPADILTWTESGFVGNIIKIQTGVALYLAPEDSNSVIYTPATPVLTYWLLKLSGAPMSVPAMRVVQFGFVLAATGIAFLNLLSQRRLHASGRVANFPWMWAVLAGALLFLAATSPRVNRYVWALHADGLSLLVSVAAWGALLGYVRNPTRLRLAAFGVIPALGFTVKPFLLCWGPVGAVVLAIMHIREPRRMLSDLVFLTALTSGLFVGLYGWFYWLWGSDFVFWVFDIMGGTRRSLSWNDHWNVGLSRSVDHLFSAWWELSLGVTAALLSLRKSFDLRIVGLFGGWLTLVAFETYTSGSSWGVLYHFGPAVLIGLSWLLAVLPEELRLFDRDPEAAPLDDVGPRALRLAASAAVLISIVVALRIVPSYDPNSGRRWAAGTQSLHDQVRSIESEFEGHADDEVLLDMGNWVYLDSGHLAKDRAAALADQPPGEIYANFVPFVDRIRTHHYKKILVRNFHRPYFLYDWEGWTKSSGVRAALEGHYREERVIPAAEKGVATFTGPYSVLVPKENS